MLANVREALKVLHNSVAMKSGDLTGAGAGIASRSATRPEQPQAAELLEQIREDRLARAGISASKRRCGDRQPGFRREIRRGAKSAPGVSAGTSLTSDGGPIQKAADHRPLCPVAEARSRMVSTPLIRGGVCGSRRASLKLWNSIHRIQKARELRDLALQERDRLLRQGEALSPPAGHAPGRFERGGSGMGKPCNLIPPTPKPPA